MKRARWQTDHDTSATSTTRDTQQQTALTRVASMAILTPDEVLETGLNLCGYDRGRQNKVCRATNLRRFSSHYGSLPIVYAQIWEDLQTTEIAEARIDSVKPCVDSFLMAIHFLKRYPTEEERGGIFRSRATLTSVSTLCT